MVVQQKINKTMDNAIYPCVADETALEKINTHALVKLTAEQVFVFKAVACDNEIDRDIERFSDESLTKLAGFLNGRSVIFDHMPTAKNQTARIYAAEVETAQGQLNSCGMPYKRLLTYCYMPKTDKNSDTILEIEAGIKKEVSVGVACKKSICSICGTDRRIKSCSHRKGQKYGDKSCHFILDEPTDGYELSFVAVPSQRAAGVTKSMSWSANEEQETLRLKSHILFNS